MCSYRFSQIYFRLGTDDQTLFSSSSIIFSYKIRFINVEKCEPSQGVILTTPEHDLGIYFCCFWSSWGQGPHINILCFRQIALHLVPSQHSIQVYRMDALHFFLGRWKDNWKMKKVCWNLSLPFCASPGAQSLPSPRLRWYTEQFVKSSTDWGGQGAGHA